MNLRLWTNGHDFVVARNADEARNILCQHNTGCDSPEHYTQDQLDDLDGDGWRECVPDRLFTLHEDSESPGGPDVVQTKTVTEWIKGITSPCWFASVDE